MGGGQKCSQYSRWGHTSTKYSGIITSLFKEEFQKHTLCKQLSVDNSGFRGMEIFLL